MGVPEGAQIFGVFLGAQLGGVGGYDVNIAVVRSFPPRSSVDGG